MSAYTHLKHGKARANRRCGPRRVLSDDELAERYLKTPTAFKERVEDLIDEYKDLALDLRIAARRADKKTYDHVVSLLEKTRYFLDLYS